MRETLISPSAYLIIMESKSTFKIHSYDDKGVTYMAYFTVTNGDFSGTYYLGDFRNETTREGLIVKLSDVLDIAATGKSANFRWACSNGSSEMNFCDGMVTITSHFDCIGYTISMRLTDEVMSELRKLDELFQRPMMAQATS